ncbi:MAG: 30S ribosomal protein S17e [Nanoarchaeota archaeon]
MGRIKSLMVKRAAKQLLTKYTDKFNDKFETNKRILGSTMPSKSTRNKIAGYIARLEKAKYLVATNAAKSAPIQEESNEPLQADVY